MISTSEIYLANFSLENSSALAPVPFLMPRQVIVLPPTARLDAAYTSVGSGQTGQLRPAEPRGANGANASALANLDG